MKRVLCRAPGCSEHATKGAFWWKTVSTDRFVWATLCDEHGIVALMKGAGYMKRRPSPSLSDARAKREKGEGK